VIGRLNGSPFVFIYFTMLQGVSFANVAMEYYPRLTHVSLIPTLFTFCKPLGHCFIARPVFASTAKVVQVLAI
jgi:hypothetical protein